MKNILKIVIGTLSLSILSCSKVGLDSEIHDSYFCHSSWNGADTAKSEYYKLRITSDYSSLSIYDLDAVYNQEYILLDSIYSSSNYIHKEEKWIKVAGKKKTIDLEPYKTGFGIAGGICHMKLDGINYSCH